VQSAGAVDHFAVVAGSQVGLGGCSAALTRQTMR
jgi:hypothetical protein